MKKKTVLIVEDELDMRIFISTLLETSGYRPVMTRDGTEGMLKARDVCPDLIILDVMMPGEGGVQMYRQLKTHDTLCAIPVIMLSMIDDRTRGYSLGAVDYLTKPVDRELLHRALSHYHNPDDVSSVLLIEDDIETREVMARTLKKAGWEVSEAGDGQQALDAMNEVQPRLILLDLMMPVMDGFEFLAAMRAHPEWQHIPVIVITAKDLSGEERDRLSGRVEEVLEKNAYTREQLLERVGRAVSTCSISLAEANDTGMNDE